MNGFLFSVILATVGSVKYVTKIFLGGRELRINRAVTFILVELTQVLRNNAAFHIFESVLEPVKGTPIYFTIDIRVCAAVQDMFFKLFCQKHGVGNTSVELKRV